MKTSNLKKMLMVGLVAASGLMVACQKSSSSDPGPVGAFGACTGCGFAQGALGTFPSTYRAPHINADFDIIWNVIGDANIMTGLINSGRSPVNDYQGSAAVTGTLVVRSLQAGQCTIPPGSYPINTVQVGQWVGTPYYVLQIPQFQAGSVLMSLNGGYAAGRIVGHLQVMKGPSVYGYPAPGAIVDCNDMAGGFILN